jgi:hypothetical protein
MSDTPEVIPQAPEPAAFPTGEALLAAFDSAKPYQPTPAPEPFAAPVAATPAAPADPTPAATPAAAPVVAPEPTPAPAAPDYAAYLKETFGVDAPEALKEKLTLAEQAEALKANQRTAQDVAFEKLLADPNAATAFVRLQTTDFKTLPARELLAAEYAHKHPELPAELARLEADLEYNAKYAAAEFEDAEDPETKTAKLRLDYATKSALATMDKAKEDARQSVLAAAKPAEAEGPTPEQVAAEEARVAAWQSGVEAITAAPAVDLAYTVDGQQIKLSFDNKAPGFQEALTDPYGWLYKQICPTGDNSKPNISRLAEIVALATQTDTALKNTLAVGKSSVGAVLPLTEAVNPVPGAPQAPLAGGKTIEQAILEASQASRSRGAQY